MENKEKIENSNFIHDFIDEDLKPNGRYYGKTIHTRFPPEPNGYLHIGHAKAICINFETALKYNGVCNLRMDDTNPSKEDNEYVESIKKDIKWLGFDWEDRFFYASDYFEKMYEIAVLLIKKGLAYVCDLTPEETRHSRGTLTQPGINSPYRERSIEENLELFENMKQGEYPDGSKTLRAKIDMGSGNMNMRDPVLYRILRAHHFRQENKWCIYPMYDFAHPIEDALESITHSLCSLEFEDHRPLYDWVINNCDLEAKPRQIEFSRLNLTYTVMSKRKLLELVQNNYVSGWSDPRMPTLSGLRRRGFTPTSIRNFCSGIGISKVPGVVEYPYLEHCLREDLNAQATRVMSVLRPIHLEITNYPEDKEEILISDNHPNNPEAGTHPITFSKHLWIETDDFMEEPIKKYFRLFPGNEVRLKYAYVIKCTGFEKDADGNITKVYAEYDPETKSGEATVVKKVKGTIHWVSQKDALNAEVRLYDTLFTDPEQINENYEENLNPNSLTILPDAKVDPWIRDDQDSSAYQFVRLGYFVKDSEDSSPDKLVFNRSVSLKDGFKPVKK